MHLSSFKSRLRDKSCFSRASLTRRFSSTVISASLCRELGVYLDCHRCNMAASPYTKAFLVLLVASSAAVSTAQPVTVDPISNVVGASVDLILESPNVSFTNANGAYMYKALGFIPSDTCLVYITSLEPFMIVQLNGMSLWELTLDVTTFDTM